MIIILLIKIELNCSKTVDYSISFALAKELLRKYSSEAKNIMIVIKSQKINL